MKRPIDIATQATVEFVTAYLPPGASILDIGCGAGHVSAALSERGYEVIGIDSDEDNVSLARQLGVNVVQTAWPTFEGGPFDGVVFTRSLHHINPLREALAKARDVLNRTGTLLIEDFAFDEVDPVAIAWFLKQIRSPGGRSLVSPMGDEFISDLMQAGDAMIAWQQHHDHDLHTAADMLQATSDCFSIRDTERVPYLYRYLPNVLPETAEAASFVAAVFQEEQRLGELGQFQLVGRRIIGVQAD